MQLVAQREQRREARSLAVGEVREERFARPQLRDVDELPANLGKASGTRQERLQLFLRERLAFTDEDVDGQLEPIGPLAAAQGRDAKVERGAIARERLECGIEVVVQVPLRERLTYEGRRTLGTM